MTIQTPLDKNGVFPGINGIRIFPGIVRLPVNAFLRELSKRYNQGMVTDYIRECVGNGHTVCRSGVYGCSTIDRVGFYFFIRIRDKGECLAAATKDRYCPGITQMCRDGDGNVTQAIRGP